MTSDVLMCDIKTSVATTDDGMMHTSGHASCIGVEVVGAQDGDHPTSIRASNRVACAITNPWNRVVGGAKLGEQLRKVIPRIERVVIRSTTELQPRGLKQPRFAAVSLDVAAHVKRMS